MVKDNLPYNPTHENHEDPASKDTGSDGLPADVPGSEKEPLKPVRKTGKGRRALQEFLGGDYLSKEWVTGNIFFLLYAALLAIIYIANTYNTEKKFKAIERTKSELKELRYEYITAKSALMFQGRQSEISRRAAKLGLREASMPPYKILYKGESLKEGNR